MKAWIARDRKDDRLYLYVNEAPDKFHEDGMWYSSFDYFVELDHTLFPEVKWEDEEPTEVEIIIKPKQ